MKLLGNRILIEPLPDADREQTTASGLVLINKWKQANLKFKVIDKGPGGWQTRKKGKRVWMQPEVEVGDCVLTKAHIGTGTGCFPMVDGLGREDGRYIIDSTLVELVWKP